MEGSEINKNNQYNELNEIAVHGKTKYGLYNPTPNTQIPIHAEINTTPGYHESHVNVPTTTKPDHFDPKPRTEPLSDNGQIHEQQYNILDHFGIYPGIPTINLLKIATIILLIIIVEFNIYINLASSKFLPDIIGYEPKALVGIGIIGIFLALLYRYFDYESEELKILKMQQQYISSKTYVKLFFIVIIMIFVILEVFIELIFTRGLLFLVDLMSITIMALGTYAIFSGKRYMVILPVLLIFIIMLIGISHSPNLAMFTLLGVSTIIYIELTDGVCRIQEYIEKFHYILETSDERNKADLDIHLDELTVKFCKSLGIFMFLTIIITSFLLMFYIAYPYLAPNYLSENLELQTVFGILPIFILLFIIFLVVYLFSPHNKTSNDIHNEK